MSHKFLEDLTSDVMFEVKSKDLKELFEECALTMFEVLCKVDEVFPEKKIKVEVEANSIDDLLFNWLQELVALVDIEEMFFSKFKVISIEGNKLIGFVYGEEISPAKGNTVVKSVTNYGFSLKKIKGKYVAVISLDI